jgi:hypothetical protein
MKMRYISIICIALVSGCGARALVDDCPAGECAPAFDGSASCVPISEACCPDALGSEGYCVQLTHGEKPAPYVCAEYPRVLLGPETDYRTCVAVDVGRLADCPLGPSGLLCCESPGD